MSGQHERAGDDAAQLRENTERTRQQLGDTAQELVDKLDVPARAKSVAQRKADEVVTQAKTVAGQVASVAKENVDTVASAARQAGEQAQQQAGRLPEPVRGHAERVVQTVRQRPALLAVAVVALLAVVRLIGQRGR